MASIQKDNHQAAPSPLQRTASVHQTPTQTSALERTSSGASVHSNADIYVQVNQERQTPAAKKESRSWFGGIARGIRQNPRIAALVGITAVTASAVTAGVYLAVQHSHAWLPAVEKFFHLAWHPVGWAVLAGVGAVALTAAVVYGVCKFRNWRKASQAAAQAQKAAAEGQSPAAAAKTLVDGQKDSAATLASLTKEPAPDGADKSAEWAAEQEDNFKFAPVPEAEREPVGHAVSDYGTDLTELTSISQQGGKMDASDFAALQQHRQG